MKARRANDHGRPSSYQRSFVVSKHALERFRDRVEEDVRYMNDFDLGNLLDERVKHAVAAKEFETIEDTRALDVESRVVRLEARDGSTFYAILRDLTIVTILEERMVQANYENESWKRMKTNKPFKRLTLKDLGDVVDMSAVRLALDGSGSLPIGHAPPDTEEARDAIALMVESPRHGIILDEPVHSPAQTAALALADAMMDYSRLDADCARMRLDIEELTKKLNMTKTDRDAAEQIVRAAEKALLDSVQQAIKGETK